MVPLVTSCTVLDKGFFWFKNEFYLKLHQRFYEIPVNFDTFNVSTAFSRNH